jgi:lipid-A-disaccharide synthase
MTSADPTVMIVAGEPSGDARAAELLFELRRIVPGIKSYGLGGPYLAAEGHRSIAALEDLSVMGFREVFSRLLMFTRLLRRLADSVELEHPRVAVLVDYPDFNLRLARMLSRRGVVVIGYISPQVWAWRAGRVRAIARYFARMIVVFPFEEKIYKRAGVPVHFVGHPLVGRVEPTCTRAEFRRRVGVHDDSILVGLLPGSRRQELERIGPVMRDAALLLQRHVPNLRAVVGAAPSLCREEVKRVFFRKMFHVVCDATYDVMHHSDALAVASGTATLEAALSGTPFVVVYKTAPLNYAVARSLVRLRDIGLVNVVAGRRIVPEAVQTDASPDRVASILRGILFDGDERSRIVDGLERVRGLLGRPGAAARAAAVVARCMEIA